MPCIQLKNINAFACHQINLEILDKEFLVLWGPTGAGKTTLLNVIAGLVKYEGSVLFNGVSVNEVPVRQRKISYLFQNLALFPHLNVRNNIAYGLTVQKKSKEEIEYKVNNLMKLMKIEHLAFRYSKNLSGGEKQRVALARAIVLSPEILLLDEPLNSLDFETARHLRMEIQQFQKKWGITTIYVTHSLEEALILADRIVVLDGGKIVQTGPPENIFQIPDGEKLIREKFLMN